MDYNTFLIRILMSFLLSLLIGLERQLRGRAIGLRTNVLVSIGAFLFVSFSFLSVNDDISRIAAQVVSGIGFLGAGVILKDGTNIRGLNTAATLWCDAAIGILCAGGYLIEAAIGTFFILLANVVLRFITMKMTKGKIKHHEYEFSVVCKSKNEKDVKSLINKIINKNEIILKNINSVINSDEVKITVCIVVDSNYNYMVDRMFSKLTNESSVISLSINRNEHKKQNLDDDDE